MESSCSTCTDFNATCIQDVPLGQCLSGLTFTASGKCCIGTCGDCYGVYDTNCLSCIEGYYLIIDNCVSICPLGFIGENGMCVIGVNPFIVLSFNVILSRLVDIASGIVFTSGAPGSFYPSTSVSNPVPAVQRGYYFTTFSSMQSEILSFSYNFTIVLYVKLQATGHIFMVA